MSITEGIIEEVPEDYSTDFLTIEGKDGIDLYVIAPNDFVPTDWLQDNGVRFFIQGGNLFKLTNSGCHSTISGVKNPKDLFESITGFEPSTYDKEEVYLVQNNWQDFNFPHEKFQEVMKYFKDIYNEYKTEAAVLLLVNLEKKEWDFLYVIQAEGSGSQVTYAYPNLTDENNHIIKKIIEDKELKEIQEQIIKEYNNRQENGWMIYGTIHSHCDFSAFHSGVDDADEENFPGLHITIGDVNSGWSYSARYIANQAEFPVDIKDILKVDDEGMKQIEKNAEALPKSDKLHLMKPTLLHTPKFITSYGVPNLWFPDKDEEENSDYDDFINNVLYEDSSIRLLDLDTQESIIVDKSYYFANKNTLFTNTEQIPFGTVAVKKKLMLLPTKELGKKSNGKGIQIANKITQKARNLLNGN